VIAVAALPLAGSSRWPARSPPGPPTSTLDLRVKDLGLIEELQKDVSGEKIPIMHVGWDPRQVSAYATGATRQRSCRTARSAQYRCSAAGAAFWNPTGTAGNMEPGTGRLDFPMESISAELRRRLEIRINEEFGAARGLHLLTAWRRAKAAALALRVAVDQCVYSAVNGSAIFLRDRRFGWASASTVGVSTTRAAVEAARFS
jgi:hypothetical protein